MTKYSSQIKKLVIARLMALSPNISFNNFTRDQLIKEVKEGTQIGNATIDMELTFIREMPKLAEKIIIES